MKGIININNIEYQVIKKDNQNGRAILKQVSKLTECLKYGGQYACIINKRIKKYLTLDCANEIYLYEI